MTFLERVLREDDVEAMVAGDSFELIVDRIRPMVTAGRRMVLAVREFTYLHRPPKVYAGLHLDTSQPNGGFWTEVREDDGEGGASVWCGIVLTNGGTRYQDQFGIGFGERTYQHSGNVTEREAWRRYHDHQAEHSDHFKRRRNMTHVAIIGGIPGRRYTHEDSITITSWNDDGVATEKVIAFDMADGSW